MAHAAPNEKRCASCGYSLVGLEVNNDGYIVCPECGNASRPWAQPSDLDDTRRIEIRAVSPLYRSRAVQAAAVLFVCAILLLPVVIGLDLPYYIALLALVPPTVIALLPRWVSHTSVRVDKRWVTLSRRRGAPVIFPGDELLLIAQRMVPSPGIYAPKGKRELAEGPLPLMQPRRFRIATHSVDFVITCEMRDAESLFTALRRIARRAIIYPATGNLLISRELVRTDAAKTFALAATLVRRESSRQVIRAILGCLFGFSVSMGGVLVVVAIIADPKHSSGAGRGAGALLTIGTIVGWACGRHALRTWRRGRAHAAQLYKFEIAALSESANL